jgi:D-psicose/D-tagatose/L-ribulose 3-epimerase
MQFGVSSLVWTAPFRDEDIPLIGHARSLGFDILEIPVWEINPFDVAAVATALHEHRVVATVSTSQTPDRDLTDPDPAVRSRGVAHLRYCVEVAAALGAPRIAGPLAAAAHSGFRLRSPAEFARDVDRAAGGLRNVADYAADHGVVLIFEPLNRYEISFGTRVQDVAQVVDAVASPHLRLMIDVFHANIEETSFPSAVEAAGDRLAYVHAIDSHRGTPGTGHLDWIGLRDALRRNNYSGPVVIEALPYQVEWLAIDGRIWHPPAPTPDELASEGLRFLRRLLEAPATP